MPMELVIKYDKQTDRTGTSKMNPRSTMPRKCSFQLHGLKVSS